MTDKQAILSILNSSLPICINLCNSNKRFEGINSCTACHYRDTNDEFPCWQHRIADMILEVIPQLDIVYMRKKGETFKVGDRVKMNAKYHVSIVDKDKVFTVRSDPWEIDGVLYVLLEGKVYPVDGLDIFEGKK